MQNQSKDTNRQSAVRFASVRLCLVSFANVAWGCFTRCQEQRIKEWKIRNKFFVQKTVETFTCQASEL